MSFPAADMSLGLAVPTYRREQHLGRLLATVPRDVLVWVSDNGADLSAAFIANNDHVSFWPVSPPVEMFANWNKAARLATTPWVMLPSDDDLYFPDSFALIRRSIEMFSDADLLVFGHHVIDEKDRRISTWRPDRLSRFNAGEGFELFKYGVDARMPSIVFRRAILARAGYFDERHRLTAADSDLIQHVSLLGKTVFVPEIVSGYRSWSESGTHRTLATKEWMDEIDYWGSKLERRLARLDRYRSRARNIRDEIFARNLVAGLAHLRKSRERRLAWNHFFKTRYPTRARLATQLRIAYHLLAST